MPIEALDRGSGPLDAWISRPSPLSPDEMRLHAVRQVEAALGARGLAAALAGHSRRRASFTTPAGQVIHIRTRSLDPTKPKPPFFTMEPARLDDGDWFVFVWNARDEALVAPTSELRQLAPGIYRSGDTHKPSFIWGAREGVGLYVDGELVRVDDWLNAWDRIAAREVVISHGSTTRSAVRS